MHEETVYPGINYMQRAKSQLTPDYVKQFPFFEGSKLSLPKFRKYLGITPEDLGKLVSRSSRTVQRQKHPNRPVLKALQPIVYGITLLGEIADPEEIRDWLHRPLIQWDGKSPMDELMDGNIEGVLNLIR